MLSPEYEKGFQDALDLIAFETSECVDKKTVLAVIQYLNTLFIEKKAMKLREVFGFLKPVKDEKGSK